MKAAFALLTDTATTNRFTKWAWRLHRDYGLGIGVRRLPPHVSLKQPFDVDDLDDLEEYFDTFAESVTPSLLPLGMLQLWETPPNNPESGVLSVAVEGSPHLRALHERLNRELTARFGECPADFDGDEYKFHVTVAAGEAPVEAYRRAFAEWRSEVSVHYFVARDVALFVYDQEVASGQWDYTTYKVLPLEGQAEI